KPTQQKNELTSPATAETSTRIAAKCGQKIVIWPATGAISVMTAAASVTTGVTFATTAAMFARTGVTSGKTAATETKLTRVGEGGKETRRSFISLEERRKLSSDQDWEKHSFTSV